MKQSVGRIADFLKWSKPTFAGTIDHQFGYQITHKMESQWKIGGY